jgi:FMNH2-dependent dimethyl sulfone monooxygenase
MKYGYWAPVFGGWLRNVADEGMEASWDYMSRLVTRSEQIGYDLTLIAELNLNDIKGVDQPALDAWSTAAALAAITHRIELMVAVRPNFHHPALFAKQAANIDQIAKGRLTLNVVSSWWRDEAVQYGLAFDEHDDRYGRTREWLQVVDGLWSQPVFSHAGQRYRLTDAKCAPKPVAQPRPTIYAGGESDTAKNMIAECCDAYVMHGDEPAVIADKIADMRSRRERTGRPPLIFGMAAYSIVRDSDDEVRREVDRITKLDPNAAGYSNFDQWLSGTMLERELKLQEYAVSNRGLRPGLTGVPDAVRARVQQFEAAGLDLLLLQMSPQLEEMERFAELIIQPSRTAQ